VHEKVDFIEEEFPTSVESTPVHQNDIWYEYNSFGINGIPPTKKDSGLCTLQKLQNQSCHVQGNAMSCMINWCLTHPGLIDLNHLILISDLNQALKIMI